MKKKFVLIFTLFLFLFLQAPVVVYAADYSQYNTPDVLNELNLTIPTWKYTCENKFDIYIQGEGESVPHKTYIYILVDYDDLRYVSFTENSFEMSQGSCTVIITVEDSYHLQTVGNYYNRLEFNTVEEFKEQWDKILPNVGNVDELVSYYIPEQTQISDTLDSADVKLLNQSISALNYNLSQINTSTVFNFLNSRTFSYKEMFFISFFLFVQ